MLDGLQRLDEGFAPTTVTLYFEIRLLDLVGFRPELQRCVACDARYCPKRNITHPSWVGRYAPGAFLRIRPRSISLNALKYMRHFQRSAWSKIKTLTIPSEIQDEINHLIQHHLTYLLEYNLKTPGFLKSVK